MCQHRALGHPVSLRGNISIDTSDDFFGSRRAIAHGSENQFLALPAVRYVLIDLLIWISDRRPVSAKKDREIWYRAHPFERIKVVAHVTFRRIDQDRTKSDYVVTGKQRAGALVVKA